MTKRRFVSFDHSPLDCGECQCLLDRAASVTMEGEALDRVLPAVSYHLAACPQCRERYNSILIKFQDKVQYRYASLPLPLHVVREGDKQDWERAPGQWPESAPRLLMSDVVQTPWGAAKLKVSARPDRRSHELASVLIEMAFDHPPKTMVRVTLRYGRRKLTGILDSQEQIQFTNVEWDHLFDSESGSPISNMSLLLSMVF